MNRYPSKPIDNLRFDDRTDATKGPVGPTEDDPPPPHEPENRGDLDDLDDECWNAFLVDDDELDPTPEPGDFWPEDD